MSFPASVVGCEREDLHHRQSRCRQTAFRVTTVFRFASGTWKALTLKAFVSFLQFKTLKVIPSLDFLAISVLFSFLSSLKGECRSTLSNAFSWSMKLTYRGQLHSRDFYGMMRRV
ncbi:hypothetical protein DPMN_051904 [Dreissena polymorpha]|uniref:Uncharacterized protein n=1 Tax=Dreissena polymorpha TaxID=45954 RepID=A0A9D4CIP3_DREPO|nr:hypothetical protein DPMN_051904 [Dreissena polymorpha]